MKAAQKSGLAVAGVVVLALITSVATNLLWLRTANAPSSRPEKRPDVAARVLETGKIRVAYVTAPPAVRKDANSGALSGIFVDALSLAARNLGVEAQWTEEVGWGTMIEGLKADKYDLVCTTVWPNGSRARQAQFTTPLYFTPIGVYVRKGDNRFTGNLRAVNSKNTRVATIDGEMAEMIARNRFPEARIVSLPQLTDITQMLLQVAEGKADITFAMTSDGERFLKANPGTLENIAYQNPIQVFPCCYMLRKDQPEFKEMLNVALRELINAGMVDDLISRYEEFPGTIYPVALAFKAPDHQATIDSAGH